MPQLPPSRRSIVVASKPSDPDSTQLRRPDRKVRRTEKDLSLVKRDSRLVGRTESREKEERWRRVAREGCGLWLGREGLYGRVGEVVGEMMLGFGSDPAKSEGSSGILENSFSYSAPATVRKQKPASKRRGEAVLAFGRKKQVLLEARTRSCVYQTHKDGSHSYMFRHPEKHIDWMRIGAFFLETSSVLLTERLCTPLKFPKEETIQEMLESCGSCVLNDVKPGIWIADLQLVRCPVCELNTCDGTMQTLDARHIELFLSEGYQDGSWEYELIGIQDVKKHVEGASGAIFDVKHIKDSSTSVFNLKAWVGKPNDWQPKAVITMHAVSVYTNLQKNEGLQVKYHVMRAGAGGEVVSIRISQQLL